ncbi:MULTISPECIES: hydroxyacylglutathione hydrolase [Planktothricoides]|uniref:Hydroxyacylglutathione hydrolase n=2 Tax=Planktothricoides raciborskii TaxID=132608 RepID=A0AAU8JHZ4_9CYAN|nr:MULTISPECIES: hydroxyacylglutathione hydrolase [Planktothricoides]KOR36168.1 hydroxyacylglutathione hydrolase [Planktothricoides sp. SR001]MBD2543712.1 hydroxyacylglutathione hydrolase [Planktothricoides raciborskii FACHB-1370]MBD2582394.1 hydroxyacylglutathione hydrolase [Planktothricoides raciborskii FACHB-1261]
MQIYRIPALSDNYIFLIYDAQKNIAAVVDPAVAPPVLQKLEELGAELVAIFNTHHHSDHVGGNRSLMERFPNLIVYGGAEDRGRIPGQQVFLEEGDTVEFGDSRKGSASRNRTGQVFFVPGHTRGHIAYYFPPNAVEDTGHLFCGDTLFAGGCGRLFEGTPAQMVNSLSKLRNLPDSTQVWCAHEYTLGNLQFAITVDGDNPDLQQRFAEVKTARSLSQPTVPSILGLEKRTNPFLRWDQPALQSAVDSQDPVQTFARLRGRKDIF